MGENRPSRRRIWAMLGSCLALAAAPMAPLTAQDNLGGVTVTIGVQNSLRAANNFRLTNPNRGSGTIFRSDLRFGVESRNSFSALTFDFDTTARAASLPGPSASGFQDFTYRLGYSRQSARSNLSFNARYNRVDLDFVDPLIDPLLIEDPSAPGGVTLVTDSGIRINSQIGVVFQTGNDMPFGLTVNANARRLDYSGTLRPALHNTATDTLRTTFRLNLSPVTRLNLTGTFVDYDAANAANTARDTRRLNLGLTHQIGKQTDLTFSMGQNRITTRRTVGLARVTTVQKGQTFGVSVTHDVSNGSYTLSANRNLTGSGFHNALNFRHQRELETGTLDFGIGLDRGTTGPIQTVADIRWNQQLATGSVSFSLARVITTNDTQQDVLTTRANANYTRTLNEVSSIGFGINLAQVEDTGAATTVTRSSARVTYNRDLTEDWRLSTGLEHRRVNNAAGVTATDNAIFVNLGRTFQFRP